MTDPLGVTTTLDRNHPGELLGRRAVMTAGTRGIGATIAATPTSRGADFAIDDGTRKEI